MFKLLLKAFEYLNHPVAIQQTISAWYSENNLMNFVQIQKELRRFQWTHEPFPASQSSPWGKPWACRAWKCTAGQCSPSAAAECCVSARTARTPSSSALPRCSYFQMPWRQPQPCSVTSNFCSAEGNSGERGGGESSLHSMDSLHEKRKTEEPECLMIQARNVRTWEKQSPSDKVLQGEVL